MDRMNNVPLIKAEKINKWFGSIHALCDVDFEVYPGEIVGLVGDNGAGKSTLIKILAGVYPKDSGKLFWKGKEVNIRSVKDSRKLGIETAFQEQALVGCLTVGENVFVGRELLKSLAKIIKIVDLSKTFEEAQKALKKLGLGVSVRKEIDFCSGGEQQGVAIARAMYYKSELLILDEPERGLSIAARKTIQNFIHRLKEEGIACVYITHDYHQVFPVAERFVIIDKGRKVLDLHKSELTLEMLENYILSRSIAFKGLQTS